MTTTIHKNLTGSDLHEPKGADTATSGKVYVSNGAGSGVWTDASTIITNTAFTTGDAKLTYKTTADTGWILVDDGTIGDGSSSATNRANADTSALFTLLWTVCGNSICPVSTGRGVSAAADFAAHKTLAIPKTLGRVLGIAGAGSGLTSRTLGITAGSETTTLVTANLPPYTPVGSLSLNAGSLTGTYSGGSPIISGAGSGVGGGGAFGITGGTNVTISGAPAGSFSGNAQGGISTPISIIQPAAFLNLMIKL